MKLYLINQYKAYMAQEEGITAVRNLPNETPYYKHEVLGEADIELPEGFTLEGTQCGGEEIFHGTESAVMVTEMKGGKYITNLVTSSGIVELYTWEL